MLTELHFHHELIIMFIATVHKSIKEANTGKNKWYFDVELHVYLMYKTYI